MVLLVNQEGVAVAPGRLAAAPRDGFNAVCHQGEIARNNNAGVFEISTQGDVARRRSGVVSAA
jgi:hypothetical protein